MASTNGVLLSPFEVLITDCMSLVSSFSSSQAKQKLQDESLVVGYNRLQSDCCLHLSDEPTISSNAMLSPFGIIVAMSAEEQVGSSACRTSFA